MRRLTCIEFFLASAFLAVPGENLVAQGHLYVSSGYFPEFKTTSNTYVDIPGLRVQFNNVDPGNACISVSAEISAPDTVWTWLRVLVDSVAASPANVIFGAGENGGTRSFNFTANLSRGSHTILAQAWSNAEARFAGRTLWVAAAPQIVNVIVAPYGPNVVCSSGFWESIPNLSANLQIPQAAKLAVTVSAVADAEGRFANARMLLDGVAALPDNAFLMNTNPISRTFGVYALSFVSPLVGAGLHPMSLEWKGQDANIRYMAWRTATIFLCKDGAMSQGEGGATSVSSSSNSVLVASSPDFVPLPVASTTSLLLPSNSSLVVSLFGTPTYSSSDRVYVRALIDGALMNPPQIIYGQTPYAGARSFSFVADHIGAGAHTIELQWRADYGKQAELRSWNTTILALPGGSATGVEPAVESAPASFSLEQNYPNPFNPVTTIRFRVAGEMNGPGVSGLGSRWVRLGVYDLLGREVAVLVNEPKAPGAYAVTFNAAGLASGVYWYRLCAGSYIETKKMILIR